MIKFFTDVSDVFAGDKTAIVDPISIGLDVDDDSQETTEKGFDKCSQCGDRTRRFQVDARDVQSLWDAFTSGLGAAPGTDDNSFTWDGANCDGDAVSQDVDYGRGCPDSLSLSMDTREVTGSLSVLMVDAPPGGSPIHE